jgi:hypothetical protein
VFLLVKQCLWHLESGRCLQPQEEFKYIRLLPCLMAVLNTDPIDGNLSGFQSSEKRLIEAVRMSVCDIASRQLLMRRSFRQGKSSVASQLSRSLPISVSSRWRQCGNST